MSDFGYNAPFNCLNDSGIEAVAFTSDEFKHHANLSTGQGHGPFMGSNSSQIRTSISTGAAVPMQTATCSVVSAVVIGQLAGF